MALQIFKIGSYEVPSAGAASVTFTIPSGYTDLKIVSSVRGTTDSGNTYWDGAVTFNSTTTGYSEKNVYGISTTTGSLAQSAVGIRYGSFVVDSGSTANTFSNNEFYIPNYSSANQKSVSCETATENNLATAGAAIVACTAGLWANTAAITSITLTISSGLYAQYSTFTVYGIK